MTGWTLTGTLMLAAPTEATALPIQMTELATTTAAMMTGVCVRMHACVSARVCGWGSWSLCAVRGCRCLQCCMRPLPASTLNNCDCAAWSAAAAHSC